MVSDADFYEAAEELLFMHSGTILWRKRISERIDEIQRQLAASEP